MGCLTKYVQYLLDSASPWQPHGSLLLGGLQPANSPLGINAPKKVQARLPFSIWPVRNSWFLVLTKLVEVRGAPLSLYSPTFKSYSSQLPKFIILEKHHHLDIWYPNPGMHVKLSKEFQPHSNDSLTGAEKFLGLSKLQARWRKEHSLGVGTPAVSLRGLLGPTSLARMLP